MPDLPIRTVRRFGWVPDLPDHRDQSFQKMIGKAPPLPEVVDLRDKMPAPYDQGELGSCTANAIGGAVEYNLMKQKAASFTPSRLFIYYQERVIENSVESDSGAMIRDGMKVINSLGAPPEELWPYEIAKFTITPSQLAYNEASRHQALDYGRVGQTKTALKSVLAGGYPIIFGFTVVTSFMDIGSDGRMSMPTPNDVVEGGHAVLAVGYRKSSVIVRNSWGKDWGVGGYFYMPWNYITDSGLADDMWALRLMEDA